jgi:hypothetical protein
MKCRSPGAARMLRFVSARSCLFEGGPEMSWYFYVFEFISGLLLTNGIPHFVQGVSGQWFQSPFAVPAGVGESSPLSNALWGFANLAAGFALLGFFRPQGSGAAFGWILVGLGVLVSAVSLSTHFGRVRSTHAGQFRARLRP